jgi:hypothetical protein
VRPSSRYERKQRPGRRHPDPHDLSRRRCSSAHHADQHTPVCVQVVRAALKEGKRMLRDEPPRPGAAMVQFKKALMLARKDETLKVQERYASLSPTPGSLRAAVLTH